MSFLRVILFIFKITEKHQTSEKRKRIRDCRL